MSFLSLGMRAESNMGIARKLENIHQSITLPGDQEKIMEFLTNAKNAQMVNSLVEDIHEALINYQV